MDLKQNLTVFYWNQYEDTKSHNFPDFVNSSIYDYTGFNKSNGIRQLYTGFKNSRKK